MNTICKQYMKNVKILFPILGKPEREYLKKLENTIADFCEDANVSFVEDLYKEFGTPSEILNSYCSIVDFEYLSKQIRNAKRIRYLCLTIILVLSVFLLIYILYKFGSYKLLLDSQPFFEETIIH